jgi:hypothetical protein
VQTTRKPAETLCGPAAYDNTDEVLPEGRASVEGECEVLGNSTMHEARRMLHEVRGARCGEQGTKPQRTVTTLRHLTICEMQGVAFGCTAYGVLGSRSHHFLCFCVYLRCIHGVQMDDVLYRKFRQHSDLHNLLLNTVNAGDQKNGGRA